MLVNAMICHVPTEFANGHQRCARCGNILSTDPDTVYTPGLVFCGSAAAQSIESVFDFDDHARRYPDDKMCVAAEWMDTLAHIASPGDRCGRCGESARGMEPGRHYTLEYGQRGDGSEVLWNVQTYGLGIDRFAKECRP